MTWSAAQYTKFEAERTRPVRDLLAQLQRPAAATAADLGCGPGNSTELLRARYPQADILGLDTSPDMIAAARKRLPETTFELDDIAAWSNPGPFDVILANASLQWVPDHKALLPRLLAKLAPGGSLAVQVPVNLDEPAHRLMRQVAEDGPWAAKLESATQARAARHDGAWYYALLRDHAATVDVWQTTYLHPIAGGASGLIEWFKSTGLRPFLGPLDDGERSAFLQKYERELARAYPALSDGTVLLSFPRLFFVATR